MSHNKINKILLILFCLCFITSNLFCQIATEQEALTIAENWINFIIETGGSWGDSPSAEIQTIVEFQNNDQKIGYFCSVNPYGFIVLSSRKELSPIKAYSEKSSPNPNNSEGMIDYIRQSMSDILINIEKKSDFQNLDSPLQDDAIHTKHFKTWDSFLSGKISSALDEEGIELPLKANWHQGAPYNYYCPEIIGGSYCNHARAGCVAIAAAQIMHYWSWPPRGVGGDNGIDYSDNYDWKNMANEYNGSDGNWKDENDNKLTDSHTDAVAELCQEVGEACGMDYGCDGSGAWVGGRIGTDMRDAFDQHFRYNENTDFEQRWHYSSDIEWFNIIKTNLNANQPVQYARIDLTIGGGFAAHSMVIHGWKVTGRIRYVYMNYGWAGSTDDTWYNLDNIDGAEGMLRKIRPAPSLKSSISGTYNVPSFEYRYFNMNAAGTDATFEAGHKLQFLPKTKVICTGSGSQRISFIGWSNNNTWLFSHGDLSHGIRINSGHIFLYKNGSIKLY